MHKSPNIKLVVLHLYHTKKNRMVNTYYIFSADAVRRYTHGVTKTILHFYLLFGVQVYLKAK
jgi:hypothetical protein